MQKICKLYCPEKFGLAFATLIVYFALFSISFAQNSFYVSPGTIVKFTPNTKISLNLDFFISNVANVTQDNTAIIYLFGNFTNNGSFFTNDTLNLNGSYDQFIGGTTNTPFYIIKIIKSGGQIELNVPIRINHALSFVSNTLFDLNSNDITISPNANIYSDDGLTEEYDSFTSTKTIINSGSSVNPLLGAYLIKEISPTAILPLSLQFPISTPGLNTPLKISLLSGGASFGANPFIKVKPVPREHPQVETPNVSLTKYWVVKTQDVTINTQGADIQGIYETSEIKGSEGNYIPLVYSPNYDTPSGYWRLNPGLSNSVDFNNNKWYSLKVNFLDGDWTAGEPSAGQATYYARANGDWNDANTWSRTYFDGPASPTIPNKRSDRIRIQGHIVTISNAVAESHIISLETGTEGRTSGILKISNENVCIGDSFKIEPNTRIYIGHTGGISNATGTAGAIQTNFRVFSNTAIYYYWGGQAQISGLGLPTNLKTIVVDKVAGSTVVLSQNTTISDSLLIIEGTLDLAASSLNGSLTNRNMSMLGGELVVRSDFPSNYTPPTFNFGQVSFDGVSNALIPSSASVPGVIQYNRLNIRGTRSGNITFDATGEIKIVDDLNVLNLSFVNNTFGFITSNSTVRFAKVGGNQNITFTPLSPVDDFVNLKFYNLILDNAGTKTISNLNNTFIFKINKNLTLNNGVTFQQNDYDIELQGNWLNLNGSIFSATAGRNVTMYSAQPPPSEITITSRNINANTFQNLKITGPGAVRPTDNLKVLNNVILENSSNFRVIGPSVDLFLSGNWTNNGGTFTHTNSTAYFEGTATQQIINTTDANETFFNLYLKNPNHLNTNSIGNTTLWGLIVSNNLTFERGRINARDRFVQVGGTITRNTTLANEGYINSHLRRNILNINNSERIFEVGFQESYTPINIKFIQNSVNKEGILQLYSDTITTSTFPISWTDGTPSAISPLGSKLSPGKHIARQWTVEIPLGSNFQTAANGKYQLTPRFRGQAFPSGDLRNGSNVNLLDASLLNPQPLNTWIFPRYYPPNFKEPDVLNRYNDSITYGNLQHFGSIVIGEPATITFFTRADGNWKNPNNWSLVYYDGPAATEYPGQTKQNYIANIGFGHEIALEENRNVIDSISGGSNLDGIISVDSSGILNFGIYNIYGSGEFRMLKNSTVKMQDLDGITALPSNLGNVRTANRFYNFNTNNSGTFIYNRNGIQYSGNGLPSGIDSVNKIITDNNNNTFTLNVGTTSIPINIKDSLYIKSSTFNSGLNNITLAGNLRIDANASFVSNSQTFSFTGVRDSQFVNAPGNLTFYNLNTSKNKNLSFVKFLPTAAGTSYNVQVVNNLNFEANNRAYIDLSPKYTVNWEPNYNNGEWYMTLGPTATVTRTNIGHIDGELRKNVPASLDSNGIRFEIGNGPLYKPFKLYFTGTVTPGYVGAQSIPNIHKSAYYLDNVNFNLPLDRMLNNYWRITTPSGSTFNRNSREMGLQVGYANPQDIPGGSSIFCLDIAYWKGATDDNWQGLFAPKGNGQNPPTQNNGSGEFCIDRKITGNIVYSPFATDTSTRATQINFALGNYLIPSSNNRTLLADVIIGQQGPRLMHFYTRKSGRWTDSTVWSTFGYGSDINILKDFPKEKLHVAHIGEGHVITLDANIGNGINLAKNDGTMQYYEQCLGMVEVEKTIGGAGYLKLGTFVIRTTGFKLHSGGILETGCSDGFHIAENRGNIIQENRYIPISRDFNLNNHNNGNYVFKPAGIITTTHVNPDYVFCNIEGFQDHKARVASLEAATGYPYNAANVFANYQAVESDTKGFIYLPFYVYWLTAGQTYTFRIHGGTNGGMKCTNMRAHLYMDWNFNGNYTDLGERLLYDTPFPDENCYIDVRVTVPDTVPQGTTQLRVIAGNGNIDDPCDQLGLGQSGGSVDFTVHISNPNYHKIHYTGAAVPAQIASLTINADSCGKYVEQNSDLSVKDSILLKAGQFSTGNISSSFAAKLQGDLINNSGLDGLRSDLGGIEFNGTINQKIRGTYGTKMWNTLLNNTGKSIILLKELTNRNLMTFQQDCKLDIELANLFFDTTSQQISPGSGIFGPTRMITSFGKITSDSVTKYFPSTFGASALKEFFFPIGYTTNTIPDTAKYNPVYMKDTISSFALKPDFSVKIVGEKHPEINAASQHYIKIYWPVTSHNFSNIDILKFYYSPNDVFGDSTKFIPAIFTNGYWRFDVGINPSASPSPISITNTHRINGDWAVFDSTILNIGTIYYSRKTGLWKDRNSWSTDEVLKHKGPPTSFYPGQLFSADTVNIDGYDITFNAIEVQVDSLRIGGTNDTLAAGRLLFDNITNGKELRTRMLFLDDDAGIDGLIDVIPGGNIADTLAIYDHLINNSSGGINAGDGATHSLNFSYIGNSNSTINGIGSWQNVSGIIVNKQDGLLDSVYIYSPNFSNATVASINPRFTISNGLLVSNSDVPTLLSGNSHTVEIKPFAGLFASKGDFLTKYHLRSYPASFIRIYGSNIFVGDGPDENYTYDTGTNFLLDSGKFVVGGAFIPLNVSSIIDLNLNKYGEITVAKYGYNGLLPSFDLSNNASSLSMTGGRIILANGNLAAVSNLTINAVNGAGMTGGTIQIGDSILSSNPSLFKIGGSTPIYDIHLVGNSSLNTIYTTDIISPVYNVKNNILIDAKQKLNLNGKILDMKGNLLSYGSLNATPAVATSDPWRITLTGISDQYLKNYNVGLNYFEIFNLMMNKPSGRLVLGDVATASSSVKVNEFLDFAIGNNSFIDAQTFSNKVILGPNTASLGQNEVFRSGLGHVFGTMSRYAGSGVQSLLYSVGADAINLYRPAEIDLSGTNTAGYLDVAHYNIMHPDVGNSKLIPAKTLAVYWTLKPGTSLPFGLGSDGKYDITSYFLNPDDIPGGSDPLYYEHSQCSPPFLPPPPGTWYSPIFAARTATSVKSRDLIQWGDFIVGNPVTTTFWSIQDGPWDDINSWSLSGYTIPNVPTRIPDQPNDIVRISNGKTITLLDNGLNPTIKSVIIETYNNLPGTFRMIGQSFVSGETFSLKDSCTLIMQNIDGINAAPVMTGSVRTNIREFGISRYIYNSVDASQLTGTGLPAYVQSLIITNSSPNANKQVFLSNPLNAPMVNVVDSLFIEQGVFESGNRPIRLLGDFVLDKVVNDGSFVPLSATITFDSTIFHNVIMKNEQGLLTYNVDLKGGDVYVAREGSKVTPATHKYVQNNLNFTSANKLILGDGTNLIVTNPTLDAITGYGSDRFIQTSHSSGMLIRSIANTGDNFYPIGSNENSADNYSPLNLSVTSITTAGQLGARVSPGITPIIPSGHLFVRTTAVSEYLKRFWMIDAVSGDFNATGRFYYKDVDVFGNETKYNRIGRWRPQNEQSPGSWVEWEDPNKDITNNWFETKSILNSIDYTGDWTLGNPFAFRRIFYSLATGNWSDPNSWTESPTHSGAIFGAGLWPNMPTDSAQIGEFNLTPHEIILDVNTTIKGVSLGTDAANRGILNTNNQIVFGTNFTMGPLSHLKITSPDGISLVGSLTGNIQSTDARTFSTDGIYEYSGSGNQVIGSGLPATLNTLIINNSGVFSANIVTVDKNISITKDLTITKGSLDLQTFSANNNSGTGTLTNSSLGRLIIGGSNNMLTAVNNYSSYLIHVDSYTEFNGILNQNIFEMPENLDLDLGLGNVDLNNGGTKFANQYKNHQMIIRGNLNNFSPALLQVMPVDNTLRVYKNIFNKSAIKNYGVIDLGN